MSATAIKALLLTFVLAGAVHGKDHSQHNCCKNDGGGWQVASDWTGTICYKDYPHRATFDGTSCNGSGINGDDFYNACVSAAQAAKYKGQAGAGYGGTCS